MLTVENHVGRLVEARWASPITLQELQRMNRQIWRIRNRLNASLVICADARQVRVLSSELATELAEIYRQHNPHVECSAMLLSPDSASAILQMERVIREAKNPARQAFRDVETLFAKFRERLSQEEGVRLAVFLGLAPKAPPA